jgi:hypothetical protein
MTPSFLECVDLRSAEYLHSQLTADADYLKNNVMDGEEERFVLHHVKNTLEKFIKGEGEFKSTYKKSEQDTPKQFRWYGNGIQGIPTKFRGLLCKGMTDIDMVNAYPSIIYNLCIKHNIPCQYLKEYCENRKHILSKECSKIDILKCINKKTKCKGSPWFVAFDYEMKRIQQALIPHFHDIHQLCAGKSNMIGSFMTSVCMYYENMFLEAIVEWIPNEVAVLMFDGLMVYGDVKDAVLTDLSQLIKDKFQFTMHFSFKAHDDSITVPDDFEYSDEKESGNEIENKENEKKYERFKLKYETEYGLAFIQKQISYALRIGDSVQIFKQEQMKQLLNTETYVKDGYLRLLFEKWCTDKNRKTYIDVGIFPHDVDVPKDYLNLWAGFAVEKLETDIEDINPILNHIKIMMNHDEPSYEFFLNWLSNLFQYPSSTSIFVSISSKEGSGKSALIDLITYMVGSDKSKEISDMSHELFGSFNAELRDVVLMNMNEVERHDAGKCYERLKTQITSPKVRIHPKGQTPYEVANLRKFISTNNNPHAIVIKEGNRRYFATESSNELIGNMEYFDNFYELIKSKSMQYSFWKFLMDRPVKKQLTARDIPETDLMREAYVLNRDPMEDFIEELQVGEKLYMDDIYTHYKQWMTLKGMEYKMNFKQFSMKFNRSIEPHIEDKGRSDKLIDGVRDRRTFIILKA